MPLHKPPPDPDAAGPLSSVIVLLLGIALAVGTAKAIEAMGIGGELVSEAVGAASGAAPLLFEGIRRRRRAARRRPRVSLGSYRYGRPPLLVGGLFGFTVLLIDTASGPYFGLMTRQIWRAATGGTDGYAQGFIWAAAFVQMPLVLIAVVCAAVAAAHRIARNPYRWLWFGIGIYSAVRMAMVFTLDLAPGPSSLPIMAAAVFFAGGLLGLVAMLGGWFAAKTQAAFTAAMFFAKLSVPDQQAALALLANHDDDPYNDMAGPMLTPRFGLAESAGEAATRPAPHEGHPPG